MSPTKSEEYRRRAEEADAKAQQATHSHARAFYRDAAVHWRLLANSGEAAPESGVLNFGVVAPSQVLSTSLGALVRTAIEKAERGARAAFYVSHGTTLHHVVGMSETYARLVDGIAIGPQSLACGLAASRREAIITRDVTEEPLWKPWLWLAQEFDYRACWSFPVESSPGSVWGTFAMYFKEPHEATTHDIDLVDIITRAATVIISPRPAEG